MAVWRLQVNTGGANIAEYCLKNHVAAMGWSLDHLSVEERAQISTFNDYYAIAKDEYKNINSVHRMVKDVKEGDLIWMRSRIEEKIHIVQEIKTLKTYEIDVYSQIESYCRYYYLQ